MRQSAKLTNGERDDGKKRRRMREEEEEWESWKMNDQIHLDKRAH